MVQWTACKAIELVAAMAVEMMVVFFSTSFIQGSQCRVADLMEPAIIYQHLQVTIDRCLVQ